MTVRRATDTIAEELGTVSPRTEEGFYLFSAPATKQKSSCNKPSQWKDEDPCKKLALGNPTKNLSDVIYECSNLNDFNVYWSADRLFSCLSGKTFYTCDVEGACQADVSVQMLTLTSTVSTVSCTSGYDLAICSVCADGFKRARDNSCLRKYITINGSGGPSGPSEEQTFCLFQEIPESKRENGLWGGFESSTKDVPSKSQQVQDFHWVLPDIWQLPKLFCREVVIQRSRCYEYFSEV
ncbi:hypothetical protein JG688_00001981 [Phytophthora aleatoria]|uniref:Uncharacterized protein n=1 Tax=Phytophthora aleatoria TaxID=2496075 RepID=A0A8J5J1G0_9STRA|nr:hypothetical protein JG688_00001981 [Phytophthora aleatoria]